MVCMGITREERDAAYASSSALLKWAARISAAALMFSMLAAVYCILGHSTLSELEGTKADLEASLQSTEAASRACAPVELAAKRVLQRRSKLGKVFSLQPALAALSEVLEPGVCLKKFELLSSECTSEILRQIGLEAEIFSSSECLYRIRLSLYARDLEKAVRYAGAFCERASSMYGCFLKFSAFPLEEGAKETLNGEIYGLYGVNIDVKPSNGGAEDELQ